MDLRVLKVGLRFPDSMYESAVWLIPLIHASWLRLSIVLLGSNGVSEEIARVPGEIGVGKAVAGPERVLRNHRILASVTKKTSKREITFNSVEAPPALGKTSVTVPKEFVGEANQPERSYFVHAQTFPDGKTFLSWWSTQFGEFQKHQCWSNVNWNTMKGFHRFEVGEERDSFMLLHENVAFDHNASRLSSLPEVAGGARYLLVAGDEDNESAMDFIEGIHAVYDFELPRLLQAADEREAEKAGQEVVQPDANKAVKKITLNFWPLTPEQKKQ